MTGRKQIRIGCGAGYSGDRIEPAVELVEKGNIQYLVFECLAERTIALAQLERRNNPDSGYDPLLERRMKACLPGCYENKIRVITNMGAANPIAPAGCSGARLRLLHHCRRDVGTLGIHADRLA